MSQEQDTMMGKMGKMAEDMTKAAKESVTGSVGNPTPPPQMAGDIAMGGADADVGKSAEEAQRSGAGSYASAVNQAQGGGATAPPGKEAAASDGDRNIEKMKDTAQSVVDNSPPGAH
eukprot:TRINITY_DN32838_c0_g1_i1.p1 TRINITY_DN32838_c0_g1~~TRINITY_DN32838_c0_g1_i1.p1  ORF type:complete len:117 (-),score=37.03 TRINITY_DN32838_c0_g1_i1:245-595(-)